MNIELKMLDEQSVRRFAGVLGLTYYTEFYQDHRMAYSARASGVQAVRAIEAMWPFLDGSDKADQVLRVLSESGWVRETSGFRLDRTRLDDQSPNAEPNAS